MGGGCGPSGSDRECRQIDFNNVAAQILGAERVELFSRQGARLFDGSPEGFVTFLKNKDYGSTDNIANIGLDGSGSVLRFGAETRNGFVARSEAGAFIETLVDLAEQRDRLEGAVVQQRVLSGDVNVAPQVFDVPSAQVSELLKGVYKNCRFFVQQTEESRARGMLESGSAFEGLYGSTSPVGSPEELIELLEYMDCYRRERRGTIDPRLHRGATSAIIIGIPRNLVPVNESTGKVGQQDIDEFFVIMKERGLTDSPGVPSEYILGSFVDGKLELNSRFGLLKKYE